ncbi:MAG: sulfatase [Planctomycetota bacterium]|nr:MAG: sulfatase [Planctomycetota bacterium]
MAACVIFGFSSEQTAQAAADSPSKSTAGKTNRPNVLFIAIDDLNDWIEDLGGYPGVKTPNLNRLARRGVLFTHSYCSAPACNPSRASLMTGIRPSTSGVYHNGQPWRPAMPNAVTLTQHFMANGYRVAGGGKIFHMSLNEPESFHYYHPYQPSPVPEVRPLNGITTGGQQFDWGPIDVPDEAMGDWKLAQWGCNYLRQKHNQSFFLAVGFIKPHLPWYVPRKYFDLYPLSKIRLPAVKEDDLDDIPEIGQKIANPQRDHKAVLETNNWEKAVQAYLATISFVDACLGKLLDALDQSPYANNTIVILWSDHGWHLGEKLHWRKFALWEEATRMPFMIVAPGLAKPNSRCQRTVSLLDIYPTMIELCGLPLKKNLEGKSLVPLLKHPNAPWDRPVVTTHGRNNHAVRSERWRYIRYQDGSEELYDHKNDPMEWTNLADKSRFASIKKKLAKWLPETNAPDAPHQTR